MLAGTGTLIGVMLAQFLGRALIAGISTTQDHVFLSLSSDWRVLSFTAGLGILTCVIFGIAPALHASNAEPGVVIKADARGLTAGRDRFRLGQGFTISQIAFSLVLMVAALLFVQTFQKLVNLNAGFQQEHILVAEFDLSPLKLPAERRSEFERELLARVRSTPGVISAAETAVVPLSGNGWNDFIDIPGTFVQRTLVNFNEVSSDYFRTLGVSIFSGRDFDDSDTSTAPLVTIVNQAFAEKYFGGSNPVGREFGVRQDGGKPDKVYRIIGLVRDTKYRDLREEYGPIAFVPESQDPAPDADTTILIRSNEQVTSLISSLKNDVARSSPGIVLNFNLLRTSIRERLGREQLLAVLSGFYGVLATVLSVVGIYGIVSYTVAGRKTEIGIRMALGATRLNILVMIARQAVTLVSIGLGLGTVLVIVASHSARALLFGVTPTDPVTLALAMVSMTVAGLTAGLLPAQRAAAVQPSQTLREG
jgi:predicted permease